MLGTKIFVASGDETIRRTLKSILTKEGYHVVGEGEDGAGTLRGVRSVIPDLVILDADIPGTSGMEVAKILEEDRLAPIILLTSTWQKELVQKAKEFWVLSFVVKPISDTILLPAVESALATFHRVRNLEKEVAKLKDTLESRKLVEKAKGILMQNLGLSEAQAFRRIQQQSMNKSMTMKAVAEAIILAFEMQKK
ncbi:Fis family transcriptional regulator [Clostridiales bacterium PH28_bin88]|nr:Fis family transcriptional regulator [Clostridiales bacterium PH28_bin88]